MRHPSVLMITVLALAASLVVGCGSDSVTAGGELPATAVPAPTVAGEIVEIEQPEVQAEVVLIGLSSTDTVELRALPGLDQPLAGDVTPGTPVEPLGQAFETEDGLVWWQVRAGALQGWIQPNVAYRGPTTEITEQALSLIDSTGGFATPDDAARAVAEAMAAEQGAGEVIVVSTIESGDGSRATVTADLLGFEDDSLLGFRLIIATGGAGFQPSSVLQAPLCARGVSPTGLCL